MLFAQPEAGNHLDSMFIHFSDRAGIDAIVVDGALRPSTMILHSIFAVAVGSIPVPGVQHAAGGGRSHAVLFRAPEPPSTWFPEEVIWRSAVPMDITVLAVLEADAADALLDGTVGIDDDGWWHRPGCCCGQCIVEARRWDI